MVRDNTAGKSDGKEIVQLHGNAYGYINVQSRQKRSNLQTLHIKVLLVLLLGYRVNCWTPLYPFVYTPSKVYCTQPLADASNPRLEPIWHQLRRVFVSFVWLWGESSGYWLRLTIRWVDAPLAYAEPLASFGFVIGCSCICSNTSHRQSRPHGRALIANMAGSTSCKTRDSELVTCRSKSSAFCLYCLSRLLICQQGTRQCLASNGDNIRKGSLEI